MKQLSRSVAPLFLLAMFLAAFAEDKAPKRAESSYDGGFSTILRLGMDIRRVMEEKHRPNFPGNPVFMDLEVTPQARTAVLTDGGSSSRGVYLSAGFVDLANYVAHARAIDMVEPGYFERYLTALSGETGELELSRLPNLENPAYWTLRVRNEQLSQFNQVVGMVLSINLAHHYHGHHEKYAARLQDGEGRPVPMASLMSAGEWLKSMRAASRNSLEAGLGMTGFISLCEAIDRMPSRPAWTEFFMHRDVSASKIRHELTILEARFFTAKGI